MQQKSRSRTGADMHERVTVLENHYGALSKRMDTIEGKTDRILEEIRDLNKTRPQSWKEIISVATSIGTLIIMIVGAIYFFIDVKTSAAVIRANSFVDEWSKEGKLYVALHDINNRITIIEKGISQELSWKAKIVASQPPALDNPTRR